MQKWEYKVDVFLHRRGEYLSDFLNKLGEQGWELCSASDKGELTLTVFKRPKL